MSPSTAIAPVLLERPLAIAAVAFLLGILSGGTVLSVSLAAFFAAAALSGWVIRRRSAFALLAIPACFFTAGGVSRALAERSRPPGLDVEPGLELVIQGTVVGAPERAVEEDRLELDLEAYATDRRGPFQPARGRVRVVVPKSNGPPCGEAGDRLRAIARVFPRDRGTSFEPKDSPIAFATVPSPLACARVEQNAKNDPASWMERERSGIHRAIDRHLSGPRAAIVRAFATGDQSGIPRAIAADFQASGLSHLLAVSGLNLAIIAGLFVVLLAAVFRRIPRIALGIGVARLSALPAIPFVLAYTLLVGASASAVRAAIMVLVLLVARIISRESDPISALALALLLMLAADPGAVADVSLELSFAAVLALLYLQPIVSRRLRLEKAPRVLRWPLEIAAASFVAALATAPITAHHFQQLSLIGVFANVPAHPIASFVLVPLALLGGLAGLVSDAIAAPILWVAGVAADGLMALAHAAARTPYGTVKLFAPNVFECAVFAAMLIAIAAEKKRAAIACAIVLGVEVAGVEVARRLSTELRVTVLPVGQGDSIVVELPGGDTWVVDTGPGASAERRPAAEKVLIPFLASRRVHRIDRLIISHPHGDHAGGLAELRARVPIDSLWWTGEQRESGPEILGAFAELDRGAIASEHRGGVHVEVLGPLDPDPKKVNDGSIVLRLSYGARAIVLAGDAERAEESSMLASCAPCLSADVLKLGHHGSKTSTSEELLDAVAPRIAIASLGRGNRFGFPHRAVTDRLTARGIPLYRTDLHGAITVITDGTDLEVRPEKTNGP